MAEWYLEATSLLAPLPPSTTRSRGGWTREPSGPPSNYSDPGPLRSSSWAKPLTLLQGNLYRRCDPPAPSSVIEPNPTGMESLTPTPPSQCLI